MEHEDYTWYRKETINKTRVCLNSIRKKESMTRWLLERKQCSTSHLQTHLNRHKEEHKTRAYLWRLRGPTDRHTTWRSSLMFVSSHLEKANTCSVDNGYESNVW